MTLRQKQHVGELPPCCGAPGPIEAVLLGLRVLASELRWLGKRAVRSLEIRQLRRRQRAEEAELRDLEAGLRATGQDPAASPERDLSTRQIAFLDEEVTRLEADLAHRRAHYVASRLRAWNLNIRE